MIANKNQERFDELVKHALDWRKTTFDFNKWKKKYQKEINLYRTQIAPYEANVLTGRWRKIMKSKKRLTGVAAAILLIALIAGLIYVLGFENHVAFAQVVEKVTQSRIVTYKMTLNTAAKEEWTMRAFVREPYNMRLEGSNGLILIADFEKGQNLVLDPAQKRVSHTSSAEGSLNIIDTFRNFRDRPGYSFKEIGRRQFDSINAMGFSVHKQDDESDSVVWVNPTTQLPVQIETAMKHPGTGSMKIVLSDIVFDPELDSSLFKVAVPEGYVEVPEVTSGNESAPVKRLKSAVNMDRILKACRKYAEGHDGQWPGNLSEMSDYGIDKSTLMNPQQPESQPGYIYLKPPTPVAPKRLVLYEAYEKWGEGINVGFSDTHVEFIKDEIAFKKLQP